MYLKAVFAKTTEVLKKLLVLLIFADYKAQIQ